MIQGGRNTLMRRFSGQDDHYFVLPQMDAREALIFLGFFRSKACK